MSLDKFKGCLVGGLVGDCLGSPFENKWVVSPIQVNEFFTDLQKSSSKNQLDYTDDTAMAFDMLDSLLEKHDFDPKDMAKRFAETYFNEKHRYYGGHVVNIFRYWKRNGFDNVYQPAQELFEGGGSFGNGGAMRIAPIALYCYGDQKDMAKMVTLTTELTHSNALGIIGALIQCFAVRLALEEDPARPLDANRFVDRLRAHVLTWEKKSGVTDGFSKQLGHLKDMMKVEKVNVGDVVKVFGNGVTSTRSVVTALYCFLRGLQPVDFLSATNAFERVVQLAIAIGGDTDTIACMAGAIAGSYLGFKDVPVYLHRRCEGLSKTFQLSAWLHQRISNAASNKAKHD